MNNPISRPLSHHGRLLALLVMSVSLVPLQAQFGSRAGGVGGPPRGPRLGGATARLFGDNSAFSATLEMQTKEPGTGETITMPGQLAFVAGNSRFAMDLTKMKGGPTRPEAAVQMKAMGLDTIVKISRSDKQVSYLVYPGLQAYVENPLPESEAVAPASDYKVQTTELGKETLDGHPCVKHKAVVTDSNGAKHESTVWNATDLKNFPIKIEQTENGQAITMRFTDITLSKPEESIFDPPAGFARYDNMQSMMQQVMMKRFGGGPARPSRDK